MKLFDLTTFKCSKIITEHYSTSFTLGIKTLHKRFHYPIYAVYGFVRYADEIVDTFHDHDKKALLSSFKEETFKAIKEKISLNPIIHAFQLVVNEYKIEHELIEAFLRSMKMDLYMHTYNDNCYEEYIYGSAEVVGLMCLRIFCEGDEKQYAYLKEPARRLGAAFQKVNFLRDIKSDYVERGRVYFPGVDFSTFSSQAKCEIENEIQEDFDAAYQGILKLPAGAKLGVYLAYIYYLNLFKKIKKCSADRIAEQRIRIPDNQKLALLVSTYFRARFNYL
ncbi:phytoene/squalene synthase family protein [Catalinimonas niigatensis]|uniref:phytoene/squalene synthase family protein n=1 Tax=Catalinimonas niigatensis TaxID=1397264 RepID=UPI0026667750|nr:phytoene/squalene synthase family protein [Catalinimonas niigatensis]WPP51552.1 phytoene/squalene synthase family protein [Catalinimonas niigatensis]